MVLFTVARAAGLLGAPDMSTYLCAFSPWRCPPLIAWSAGATRADLGLGRTDVRAGLGYGAGAFGTAVAVWVLPSGGLWPAGRRAQLLRRAHQTNRTTLVAGPVRPDGAAGPSAAHQTGAGRAGGRRGRPRSSQPFSTWPRGGVKTVGTLPQGVPVPALPWTKWSGVGPPLVGAVGITLVSLTDTIATATSFAARRGDEVDPDHEMVGIGTSNIAAGFFQGFAVSLRGSRAAVADQSGARTQLTGLAGAGLAAVGVHRHSSSHAIASRTWCTAMASTPRWTESTSIPVSTRPSMRSTMRRRTALCRPMKGCRLHENRP